MKIDQHVAAENQVKWTSDVIRFPSEIEPLKPDDLTEFVRRLDFAFVRAKPLEQKPSLIVDRNAGDFLDGPDGGGSAGQNFGREIRSENLDIPSRGRREIRQHHHGQRIGFFTGGTGRAPDAQRPVAFAGIRVRHPFGENAIAQTIEGSGFAEEMRFVGAKAIEHKHHFPRIGFYAPVVRREGV